MFDGPGLEVHRVTVLERCAVHHNHCCVVTYLHRAAGVGFNCPSSGRGNIIQRGTYMMWSDSNRSSVFLSSFNWLVDAGEDRFYNPHSLTICFLEVRETTDD
jgi:hypothetical protein